jgi:hypothetical protein
MMLTDRAKYLVPASLSHAPSFSEAPTGSF